MCLALLLLRFANDTDVPETSSIGRQAVGPTSSPARESLPLLCCLYARWSINVRSTAEIMTSVHLMLVAPCGGAQIRHVTLLTRDLGGDPAPRPALLVRSQSQPRNAASAYRPAQRPLLGKNGPELSLRFYVM